MVEGQIKQSEVPYRQKEGLNFSSIKLFDERGVGMFYKEFILGDKKDKESSALAVGSMVDDIILNYGGNLEAFYQGFDEKYAKLEGVKSSAQAFVLADTLFDCLMETAVDGKITADFEYAFKEAFDKVQAEGKYKGKTWDKGLEDFNKVAKDYFDKKINSIGKTLVDLVMISTAENVAKTLLTDDFTKDIFASTDLIFMPKVVVEFNYLGVVCKSELDGIQIDHANKTITPCDLKCTFDNEEFPYMYLRNKYYLQQAFYTEALKYWKVENGLEDYTILPFKFIVGDTSANKRRPLVYQLSSEDMTKGFTGFILNGNRRKGIKELVEEIKWHMDMDIWNCSKESYVNNGVLNLSINYDKC